MASQKERQLQSSCVLWFRVQYRKYDKLLLAVPNGAYLHGTKTQRAKQWNSLKKEGAVEGASDLILLVPNPKYHGLCIEMKYGDNDLSQNQIDFKKRVVGQDYAHAVCRSFDQFRLIIKSYFDNDF